MRPSDLHRCPVEWRTRLGRQARLVAELVRQSPCRGSRWWWKCNSCRSCSGLSGVDDDEWGSGGEEASASEGHLDTVWDVPCVSLVPRGQANSMVKSLPIAFDGSGFGEAQSHPRPLLKMTSRLDTLCRRIKHVASLHPFCVADEHAGLDAVIELAKLGQLHRVGDSRRP